MIRRKDEVKADLRENVQGGKGTLRFDQLLEQDKGEFFDKGRLYSMVTINPGDTLGYHVHNGEMECYYILSGEGIYDDNGTVTTVKAGDVTVTNSGEGHSIENQGKEPLLLMALILYC